MSYLQTILMWFSLVAVGVLSAVGFAVWRDQHQVFPGGGAAAGKTGVRSRSRTA